MLNKILICSLGSIGRKHLVNIKKYWPEVELGVWRSGEGYYSSELNQAIKVFKDLDKALDWKPKGCIIASPAKYHLSIALKVAKRNVPVLIEKPIGTGEENELEWELLRKYSEKLPIMIGYVFRYDACAIKLKEEVERGKIGRILDADFQCSSWLPEWRKDIRYEESVSALRELGGGVLLELSHEIDLAHWLFGEIRVLGSFLGNSNILDIDVEDYALVTAVNNQGVGISIRLNFCSEYEKRVITIRGSKGELIWDLNQASLSIETNSNSSLFIGEQDRTNIYKKQFEHFFNSILNNAEISCTVSEALKTLNFIKNARYYSDNGKQVKT